MYIMSIIFVPIKVSKNTHEMMKLAKKELIRHHPELEETFISNNKIIYTALKYYMES